MKANSVRFTMAVSMFLLVLLTQSGANVFACGIQNSVGGGPYVTEYPVPTLNSGPMAIATDVMGNVWFTESNSSKIGRFSPSSGEFKEFPVPEGTGDMWGIIVSRDGLVWFTRYGASSASTYVSGGFQPGGHGQLWSFDPQNETFRSVDLPKNGTVPFRLAEDQSGRIWFTELLGDSLVMFDPRTAQLKEFQTPTRNSGPADLTIDANGLVWFTESEARSIAFFNPANSSFREFHFQELSAPVGISIEPSGLVWIADHGLNRIGVFDPGTSTLQTYPTSDTASGTYPYSLPNDIVVDHNGEIWFTEHAGNRVGKLDSTRHSLTEYEIPSGPISAALWLTTSPSGDIWFAEYSTNRIGFLNTSLVIPFRIESDQYSTAVQQGSDVSIRLTVGGTSRQLRLFYATNSPPQTLSASFSVNPVVIDSDKEPNPIVTVDVQAYQELAAGKHAMLMGASDGQVSVSALLLVNVTSYAAFPQWAVYLITTLTAAILLSLVAYRIKRSRAGSGRSSSRSLHSLLEDHKIAIVIFGVASTNFVGAITGLLHLIILQAPTRTVPLSNAILTSYGFYAFWLDVTELSLGVMTVYAVLLAWKPNRRIRSAILLTAIAVASTLVVVSVVPGGRPMQCDVVIRNSLFYGSYSPSSLQATLHDGSVTVTWCVDSNSVHADTVTSDTGLFNSGPIAQGASWSYTFTRAGEYQYHSIVHFWMRGSIEILPSEQSPTAFLQQSVSNYALATGWESNCASRSFSLAAGQVASLMHWRFHET